MRRTLPFFLAVLVLGSTFLYGEDARPLILVSNDDGVQSEGIKALAGELEKLGDVVVVAPLHNSSGVGHGITYKTPISYGPYDQLDGLEAWWVDALPASCVRWGLDTRFGGRSVDLVVSGINDGSNLGAGIYYSGTVGAAREGALYGTAAIAVSMEHEPVMDYAGASARIREIAAAALDTGRKPLLLNVNFPAGKIDASTPVEITTLTRMRWPVDYHDRANPRGGNYFWITFGGGGIPEVGSDAAAVAAGHISVTALTLFETDKETSDLLAEYLESPAK
jgi:5'-nucleotidase